MYDKIWVLLDEENVSSCDRYLYTEVHWDLSKMPIFFNIHVSFTLLTRLFNLFDYLHMVYPDLGLLVNVYDYVGSVIHYSSGFIKVFDLNVFNKEHL